VRAAHDGGSFADGALLDRSAGPAVAPLCPGGFGSPGDAFHLELLLAYKMADPRSDDPSSNATERCAVYEEPGTLTLGYDPSGKPLVTLEASSSTSFPLRLAFGNVVTSLSLQAPTIHFADNANDGNLDFELDQETGVITGLNALRTAYVDPFTETTQVNAIGWPICDATDSSPPAGMPLPPLPDLCASYGLTESGCERTFNRDALHPPSSSTCEPYPSTCNCKIVLAGLEVRCCP
jgi:hypothetical protein